MISVEISGKCGVMEKETIVCNLVLHQLPRLIDLHWGGNVKSTLFDDNLGGKKVN